MPPENLHVTLLFLGSVPQQRLSELETLASAVATASAEAQQVERARYARASDSATELIFDTIEFWRKASLLVATARGSAPGSRVAENLASLLLAEVQRAGFISPPERPRPIPLQFRPHVTLVRDVRRPKNRTDLDAVTWPFHDFALVDSRTGPQGSVYTVLQRFPIVDSQE